MDSLHSDNIEEVNDADKTFAIFFDRHHRR